ncbi:MAG: family N-acetyltransferase [Chloroflexi bacterium]|nr:family N-acetyltransferase [Chloroflexota bacterium]
MVWRATLEESRQVDGKSRKAAFSRRVQDRIPVGILGYLDDEPVAWCSIAPRLTYRRLGGMEDAKDDPDAVWSLACMFITRRLRGLGMARAVVEAAVAHARSKGASVVEAYPVDPDSPSYRFMGFVPLFEREGFDEVGRAGTRRHVMRLRIS